MRGKKRDVVRAGEFRHNKARTGHPAYIVEVKINPDKKARFLGITDGKITHGERNLPLKENPDPKQKGNAAYIRPSTEEVKYTNTTFGKKLEGWKFSEKDKPTVEKVIHKKG